MATSETQGTGSDDDPHHGELIWRDSWQMPVEIVKITIDGILYNMEYLSTIPPAVKISIDGILDNTGHLSTYEFSHGEEQPRLILRNH